MKWPRLSTVLICAVVLIVLLVCAACGAEDAPTSGYVRDKRYSPAYTDYITVTNCYSYDKNGQCTLSVPSQIPVMHDERYELFLKNCDQRDKDGRALCKTGWLLVEREDYERAALNKHWPDPR